MACLGNFAFASATQGWFVARNKIWEVPFFLAVTLSLMRPDLIASLIGIPHEQRYWTYFIGLAIFGLMYLVQRPRMPKVGTGERRPDDKSIFGNHRAAVACSEGADSPIKGMHMKNVKKVLVALAFSEYAKGTFSFAAQFAQCADAELIVASVINSRDVESVQTISAMGYEVDGSHYIQSIKDGTARASWTGIISDRRLSPRKGSGLFLWSAIPSKNCST
jgi:hypothetical protein